MADVPLPTAQSAELERERLTSLINSMADGVIAVDEKGKIVVYNGAALNIMDVNSSMANKSLNTQLVVVDKNNQPLDIQKIVLDTKTSTASREWRLQYPDKSTINLYISIAPVKLGYGQEGTKGFVVLLRDITREKSLEEERDEFISVVSHELRTPITIAEGNISNAEFIVTKSSTPDSNITQALKVAHDQVNFLSSMINDLSTLSRADQGKLSVEVESINVHDLVTDLDNLYGKDAAAKDLKLKLDIDPHLEVLKSSRLYTNEILQNFITNAIKYTETGSVTVGARQKDSGIEFYVQDTGIGISKIDQEKVWDKFFRADNSKTRAANGTGLGLYVTMKLARLIHAEIDLTSEPGEGSTFKIFIPNLQ